jgi:hypothetical protein
MQIMIMIRLLEAERQPLTVRAAVDAERVRRGVIDANLAQRYGQAVGLARSASASGRFVARWTA